MSDWNPQAEAGGISVAGFGVSGVYRVSSASTLTTSMASSRAIPAHTASPTRCLALLWLHQVDGPAIEDECQSGDSSWPGLSLTALEQAERSDTQP